MCFMVRYSDFFVYYKYLSRKFEHSCNKIHVTYAYLELNVLNGIMNIYLIHINNIMIK